MTLAAAYNQGGEYSIIISLVPSVIDLLEKTGRKSESFGYLYSAYSILCLYYGESLAFLGSFEEGKVFIEKALRNVLETGALVGIGISEFYYGTLFLKKGAGKLAIEHYQNSIRYFDEVENFYLTGLALSCLGNGYHLLGDLETAQKHVEKGLEIQSDSGLEAHLSLPYLFLSSVHFDSGDLQKAQGFAEKAVEISQKNNERHYEGLSRIWLGRILGKGDQPQIDKAEKSILQGMKIYEESMMRPFLFQGYLFLAELYANTGQREKALENLNKAEDNFREMGMDYWLAKTYAIYAELNKKEGDKSKAKENLNKAIEILKDCGADGWVKKYEKELAALS